MLECANFRNLFFCGNGQSSKKKFAYANLLLEKMLLSPQEKDRLNISNH